jgi:hypothetical protein
MIRRRNCRKQPGFTDAEFACLVTRLEMRRDVGQQGDMADCQKHRQDQNPESREPAHPLIL